MPDRNDDNINERIREQAREQMPDAWPMIERKVRMAQNTSVNKQNKGIKRGIAAGAAALVVVAAGFAVVSLTKLPTGATAPAQTTAAVLQNSAPAQTTAPVLEAVRTPTPFSDSKTLTPNQGPMVKIVVHESIKDLLATEGGVTAVHVKFGKQISSGPKAGLDPIALFSRYEMEVVDSFQGSLKAGDKFELETRGGATDGSWLEDNFMEKLTGDYEYVLFLVKNDDGCWGLANPMQGYVPLKDGKVSLNSKIEFNGLFQQGESAEDLFKAIQAAAK